MKTAHDLVLEAKKQIQEISVEEAQSAIKACDVLIDVREADEFNSGHIPGAVNMSRGLLEFKLSSDPALQSRDIKIVLYCKTSGRAALCANSLKNMGYLHVQSIAGGVEAWQAQGYQIVKPSQPKFD